MKRARGLSSSPAQRSSRSSSLSVREEPLPSPCESGDRLKQAGRIRVEELDRLDDDASRVPSIAWVELFEPLKNRPVPGAPVGLWPGSLDAPREQEDQVRLVGERRLQAAERVGTAGGLRRVEPRGELRTVLVGCGNQRRCEDQRAQRARAVGRFPEEHDLELLGRREAVDRTHHLVEHERERRGHRARRVDRVHDPRGAPWLGRPRRAPMCRGDPQTRRTRAGGPARHSLPGQRSFARTARERPPAAGEPGCTR
jgi:hypothetical protein